MSMSIFFFFLIIRRPPSSTRPDTLFPYTTLFRSTPGAVAAAPPDGFREPRRIPADSVVHSRRQRRSAALPEPCAGQGVRGSRPVPAGIRASRCRQVLAPRLRSEEHTSELQSLMRHTSAVFCLKKTKQQPNKPSHT